MSTVGEMIIFIEDLLPLESILAKVFFIFIAGPNSYLIVRL